MTFTMGGTDLRTVKLTTWERGTLKGCIPPTCPTQNLSELLRLVDILTLTEDEEDFVSLIRFPDGRIKWKKAKHLFDIEFSKIEWRTMIKLVRDRQKWPTLRESEVLLDKMEDAAAIPIKKEEKAGDKEDGQD